MKKLHELHDAAGRFAAKYTDQQVEQVKELRAEGWTLPQIQRKTGLSSSQVHYLVYLKKPDEAMSTATVSNSKQKITRLTNGSFSVVDGPAVHDEDLKDESAVMLAHGFDPNRFLLTSVVDSYWGENSEGLPLYQTKIKLTPKTVDFDKLADDVSSAVVPVPPVAIKRRTGKNTLVIPLFDLHFGISTASTMQPYLDQIEAVIETGFKNILIILGGDIFHSDSVTRSVTVKGTQLDHVDMAQALDDADQFFTELMSEACLYSRHVSVISVPGNHDFDVAYVWARAMKAKYAEAVDYFDVTRSTWATVQIGHVGILAAHGDVAKARLRDIFSTEAVDIWAASKFRAIFSGHFHKEVAIDDFGCELFQVGTPKPADAWEIRKGLVMSKRKMELFTFDDSHLVSTYYIYPDYKEKSN